MSASNLDSQVSTIDSQASEDWATEDESDYDDYYGEDEDVMSAEEGAIRDASFQVDPEYYEFSCLSTEETWNYLDSLARETSKEIKVCPSYWCPPYNEHVQQEYYRIYIAYEFIIEYTMILK